MDLRQKILSAKVPREKLVVPDVGEVWVRGLTGEERDSWEQSMLEGKGKSRQVNLKNARAKLVQLAACDENGKQLFTKADIEQLGQAPARILDPIYNKATELSGISEEDVDELVKN